jgi:hypothetical protein
MAIAWTHQDKAVTFLVASSAVPSPKRLSARKQGKARQGRQGKGKQGNERKKMDGWMIYDKQGITKEEEEEEEEDNR